jgi:hypothetical protein
MVGNASACVFLIPTSGGRSSELEEIDDYIGKFALPGRSLFARFLDKASTVPTRVVTSPVGIKKAKSIPIPMALSAPRMPAKNKTKNPRRTREKPTFTRRELRT